MGGLLRPPIMLFGDYLPHLKVTATSVTVTVVPTLPSFTARYEPSAIYGVEVETVHATGVLAA